MQNNFFNTRVNMTIFIPYDCTEKRKNLETKDFNGEL